jgi:hypothetical protein
MSSTTGSAIASLGEGAPPKTSTAARNRIPAGVSRNQGRTWRNAAAQSAVASVSRRLFTPFQAVTDLGRVTRARMTQIMNLLNLAPDIQEEILVLPKTTTGRDPVSERGLRRVTALVRWDRQRKVWRGMHDKL